MNVIRGVECHKHRRKRQRPFMAHKRPLPWTTGAYACTQSRTYKVPSTPATLSPKTGNIVANSPVHTSHIFADIVAETGNNPATVLPKTQ